MRIFVTGATGVVGRRVVPQLIAASHEVTAVGRTAEKRERLSRQGAEPVDVDLFDAAAVTRAVTGHDAVVNLATHMPASSARMLLPGAWRENDRLRRDASRLLVDAATAAGATRYTQESFAPAYPDGGDGWIDESTPLRPAQYNRTLLDAERSAERFTDSGGIGVVVRFANLYGPDSRLLVEVLGFVRRGLAPLPGGPTAFLSSVSHDDAAAAVVAALGVPPGAYNVADDDPMRRRDYADALASAFGLSSPRLPPAWTGRLLGSMGELLSRSQRISNAKLRSASAWTPRFPSAREGLRAAAEEMPPSPR